MVGWSVCRLVDARVPVDHASVGLAHAGLLRLAPTICIVMVQSEAYLILHMKPCRRQVLRSGEPSQISWTSGHFSDSVT